MSVENFVSLVAVGFAEELLVDLLDSRILVGSAERLVSILLIESACTKSANISVVEDNCGLDGLTTAVDAAARAAHDLDEVILTLASLDIIKKLGNVLETGSNSNLNLSAVYIIGSLLDAFKTANVLEVNRLNGLAGENFNSSTESSLHNAAGNAEDNAGAGGFAKDRIEIFLGKEVPVDAVTLDELSKLTCGENGVNISITGSAQLITAALELLSGAGHDGYGVDACGVDVVSLSIPGLDNSTLHLLGALAGRKVGNELGIVMLAEVDPTGGAGSDHRELAAILDAVDKLVALFHDGEVSSEIGIKDSVEANAAESSSHLAGNRCADSFAEALAESCTDSRSCLNNNVLGGIVESFDNLIGIVLLAESAGRANVDALTAGYAGNVIQLSLESAADVGVKATCVSTDDGNVLILAGCNAAAAKNALGVVADKVSSRSINGGFGLGAGEVFFIGNTEILTELLEFAVVAAAAGEALSLMVGEDELQGHSAAVKYLLGVGDNFHALVYGVNAGSNKGTSALYLNNADTASADLVHVLEEAKGGDINSGITSGLKNGRTLRNSIIYTVNFNVYHIFHFRHTPFLFLFDCVELTGLDASTALDALGGVNSHGGELVTGSSVICLGDSANRTLSCASTAANALLSIDGVVEECLTYACGTLLVNYMSDIFIAEETKGRDDGVGSSLTETAERILLDVNSKLFELINVRKLAVAAGDLFENFIHSAGTDTAGSTLTAGLINSEVEEELSNVNHAVVFVHNDKTAGADHSTDRGKVVIVKGNVEVFNRYASTGRTAELCCLELLAARYAAADFVDNGGEGSTHRDFNKTGVVDLAAESEYLGAGSLLGAEVDEPFRTVEDDLGDVSISLNVVENGRLAEETLNSRERRTGTGFTAVTLDGGHKSGFLAADECACAQTKFKVEVKAGAEDVLAEKTHLASLTDSNVKTMDSDRILSSYIDVTHVCADCVTCNSHSLDNSMGVAFKNGTVHECAGVAFVSVTADILLVRSVCCCKAPLETGGEAAAASAAETGILDNLNNLLRGHFGENLTESSITVHSNVLFDDFGVDNAAVTKSNTVLSLVESGVAEGSGLALCSSLLLDLFGNIVIDQSLDYTTLVEMLANDVNNILSGNVLIENAFGINYNNGTKCAKTETTGLNDLYLFGKTLSGELLGKCGLNSLTA